MYVLAMRVAAQGCHWFGGARGVGLDGFVLQQQLRQNLLPWGASHAITGGGQTPQSGAEISCPRDASSVQKCESSKFQGLLGSILCLV